MSLRICLNHTFLFLFCLASLEIHAQEVPAPSDIVDTLTLRIDLFEEEDPMVITMKFDIKAYQRNKRDDTYMPAELIYHVNDTLDIRKTIRLKARGNFRRNYCSMPPFWLNIRKANVESMNLQDVKRMKVVTHCNGGSAASNYVLKEYLAYRIYNTLSPYSFRVRLIQMKYIDTGRRNRKSENWAFVIEPENLLVQRNNMYSVKNNRLGMTHMLPEDMDRVALFQYMIGNADYSVTGRHNVKLIAQKEIGIQGFIPVPYDFDYSGLVNASYAVPGENLGIQSVTERYYLGPCRDPESYRESIDLFNEKREEIIGLVEGFPLLDQKQKGEMRSYLNEFFNLAGQPDLLYGRTRRTCR
jgi:hypothetical protein